MKQEIRERIEKIRKGEVPEGYKKTKVGIIPGDWEVKMLGEKTTKIGSGITPTGGEKVYTSEGRPFLRSQNVGWGNLILEDIAFIGDEIHNTFKATEIIKNDVFLNITGASIGRSAIADERVEMGNVNQHVCIIRTIENELNPKFLNYFLLSKNGQKQIDSYQAGGNRQGLNFGQIKSFQIPLPPILEQTAIVTALIYTNALVSQLEKLIKEKMDLKRGLMQTLLTRKMRFPEFTGEWRVIPLKNLVERITSKNKDDNKTVITISSKEGFVNQDEYFNKLIASKDLSEYFLIKKGDFVYNKSYSNGYPVGAIKRLDSFENAVVTTLYICFRIKYRKVSSNFLKYYFDSGLLNNQIKRIANEGGRAHGLLNVTPNDFFNVKVKLPEYEEQEKISEILLANEQDIQLSEKYLFELKEQNKGLMQLLLTGIVRVNI